MNDLTDEEREMIREFRRVRNEEQRKQDALARLSLMQDALNEWLRSRNLVLELEWHHYEVAELSLRDVETGVTRGMGDDMGAK